ncbi:epoxide hydrolase EphF [Kitasatospora phosalacinea]|uniref:Epoxide hydrolase EphF n=1 Tax=Kitasatospora phosalacinea TaxID=2065 RepID=A0A9W6V298_9ACTN|nr:alpha/beta hydrolase [Kitasatospora phosalacinea]GLW70037.1 epoxide hydrolase EphF [Kitasatospora phosalacinea]
MTRRLAASQRPLPELAGVRHRTAEVGGLRLHYAEAGPADASPVVLVHGFPQHWYAWRRVLPLLAGEFRLLCLDMPGFGWSEGEPGRWSTEARAADLVGFLDALELESAFLVSHDWGAWAGFLACARQPERFDGHLALNMVHLWPERRATLGHAWRFWYTLALEWPPVGRAVLRHCPAFTRFLLRRGPAGRTAFDPAEVAEYAAAAREPLAARAGEAVHRAFVVRDIAALRRREFHGLRLRTPTLALTGERDPVIPPQLLASGAELRDGLRVETVPGAGHQLPAERPELVAERARALFGR